MDFTLLYQGLICKSKTSFETFFSPLKSLRGGSGTNGKSSAEVFQFILNKKTQKK